jgi:integrase
MPLTDAAIRKAPLPDKPKKLSDGRGLFLLLNPNGSKWWRLKYRFGGVEKQLSLGTYPEISLAEAREAREAARKLLATGRDPSVQRKVEKAMGAQRAANSFETVAQEWLDVRRPDWTQGQFEKERLRLKNHAFPRIGTLPISDIGVAEIRPLLNHLVRQGYIEQAHRLRHQLSRVFRFAVATERASRDPAADLRDTLPARNSRNHPTITDPVKVGELMRAINSYRGDFTTQCALKLAPLWFCRPGEIRKAEWTHFDLDGEFPAYKVPPSNQKLKKAAKENPLTPPYVIPLSRQALEILRELRLLTGHRRYLFPGARDPKRCMSENTVNSALATMGYKGVIVGHGFRHMARTLLAEMGCWNADALELQLSHKLQGVVGVYNKAQHLPERRKMMQAWADHLDDLRNGTKALEMSESVA